MKAVEIYALLGCTMKQSCGLLKTSKQQQKQLSGSTSNQLFTAKGKYHLFFTLWRKRFIYLGQSHGASCPWKAYYQSLPSSTGVAPPGSPVPINGLAFHVSGWADSPSEGQTDGEHDCSRSWPAGCWRFGRRCSFPCIELPPGAVLFIEGGAWREVHSFPARRTYTLHMAHMVHAWLAERKKKWELQMDLVSAKISTPKDSGRKNALKP